MRTHLEFHSTHFPAYPDEDELVNPNRYGKRLAEFLAESLKAYGYTINRIVNEDWGWMVEIENPKFSLWIGCGNYEEMENGFLCFIEPSKPYIWRWFRWIHVEPIVEKLASDIEALLKESEKVTELRWWDGNNKDIKIEIDIYEKKYSYTNNDSKSIEFIIEPWGMPFELHPKSTIDILFNAKIEGQIEIREHNDCIEVWGWTSSNVDVCIDDVPVYDSEGSKVPPIPNGMTTKGFLNIVFGEKKKAKSDLFAFCIAYGL